LLRPAHTLPQRRLEVDRPAVFAEQVAEGLVGEILEVPRGVLGKQIENVPGLQTELNALAGHHIQADRQWSGFFLSFKCRTLATRGECPCFCAQSIASRWVLWVERT